MHLAVGTGEIFSIQISMYVDTAEIGRQLFAFRCYRCRYLAVSKIFNESFALIILISPAKFLNRLGLNFTFR